MRAIRSARESIKEFRRAYVVLNLVYYGLVVCAMIYVSFNPSLQQTLAEATGAAFTEGPLSALGGAYVGGQVWLAVVLTFVVNLVVGSLAYITLPSLVLPFSGLLLGAYRALVWGLILSPTRSSGLSQVMIPHSLTLLLEGQAYILAMLAAYIHGRAFLWPHTVGETGHRRGYVIGLKRSLRLYCAVVILLALAAIYEALEVIFIMPLLR